jgi:hypothetical protein
VLFMAALQLFALGVIADLISAHRTVSQRTLERVRRLELQLGVEPSHYLPDPSVRSEPLRPDGHDARSPAEAAAAAEHGRGRGSPGDGVPRTPGEGTDRSGRAAATAPSPQPPPSGAAPSDEAPARS